MQRTTARFVGAAHGHRAAVPWTALFELTGGWSSIAPSLSMTALGAGAFSALGHLLRVAGWRPGGRLCYSVSGGGAVVRQSVEGLLGGW